MREYLEILMKTLILPLQDVLRADEMQELHQVFEKEIFNEKVLKGLQPNIDVYHGFSRDEILLPLMSRNSETTRVKAKQQATSSELQKQYRRQNYRKSRKSLKAQRGILFRRKICRLLENSFSIRVSELYNRSRRIVQLRIAGALTTLSKRKCLWIASLRMA